MKLRNWLNKFIMWYYKASPIEAGKWNLIHTYLSIFQRRRTVSISAESNIKMELGFPEDRGYEYLAFFGKFEPGVSKVFQQIIRPSDTVFDIGANMGWYTVLASSMLQSGTCFAFEPNPELMERTVKHIELNGLQDKCQFFNVALSEQPGSVTLHVYERGHGLSSIQPVSKDKFTPIEVEATTVDLIVEKQSIQTVDFVKMDVEGAELMVLLGSRNLLTQQNPPIWIIEINFETARMFKHEPMELLQHLKQHGDYSFYRIDAETGDLTFTASENSIQHGDNVLCVPQSRMDRLSRCSIRN